MVTLTTIGILALFLIAIGIAYYVGHKIGEYRREKHWEVEVLSHRKEAIAKSRAVLGGQFSEQLAPYLPDFPYSPSEARFIGKPIDLIVFKGMDEKDINEIVFVEVKSGKSRLSPVEKKLKEAVEAGKVTWEEYRIPEDITKKPVEEE